MPKERRSFDAAMKTQIVREYLAAPPGGGIAILQKYNLASSVVRRWTRRLGLSRRAAGRQSAGAQTVRPKGMRDEVLAELAGGARAADLARKYGIHPSTVYTWKHRPPRRQTPAAPRDLVAITNQAVQAIGAPAPGRSTVASLIKQFMHGLRGVGIDLEELTIHGDECSVAYKVKETITL